MRRRSGQPAGGVGIGQFAGAQLPQNLTAAGVREAMDAMSGDPGIRLARGRGGRKYLGGGLIVQEHVGAHQDGANSAGAMEALPLKAGTRSRALGQNPSLIPLGS